VSIIEKAVAKLGDWSGSSRTVEAARTPEVPVAGVVPEHDALSEQATTDALETTRRYEELDVGRLKDAGMVTPDSPRSQIFEEFRLIKRPLLKNALGQGPTRIPRGNLIMVTSCMPGEGKSFCSLNLAMSIAMEMDHTVLLVDADVAKPSIPRMLGIEGGLGLMDVLLEENLPISQVLIRTNIDKLRLMTAGRHHPNATELLASGAMGDLLDEMSRRYSDRIIIFDSPPLLATTESRVLASQMGQVVLVVEAGKTTEQKLREGLQHLGSCETVNLLLNKARFKGESGYYGYGYGYGYAYGYGYGAESANK
jgi:exopolysaccharide/PEP-CTERM locus tyrosine autokinase